MNQSLKISIISISTFICVFYQSIAWSLDSDKNQPISMLADRANIDDKVGISIFYGNVVMSQGSMQLKADKVTTYYNQKHEFVKMVAEKSNDKNLSNKQTFFSQRPEGESEDVRAQADIITYFAESGTILLNNNASFWQLDNIFRGNEITYMIEENRLKAIGKKNEDGQIKSSNRVHVTISPKP